MNKSILISSFGAFGDIQVNPTQRMLETYENSSIDLHKILLPVSFQRSQEVLLDKLNTCHPDWIFLTGVAADRDHISLEKVAINHLLARIPDVDGDQPLDERVIDQGPDALFATVPYYSLMNYLLEQGVNVKPSYHAGTYVCNSVFFHALWHLRQSESKVVFVHVPNTDDIEMLQNTLDAMINFTLNENGI